MTVVLPRAWQASRRTSVFKLKLMANPYLLVAIVIYVSLQVLVTTTPWFEPVFGTVALSWQDWLAITLVASSVLWNDEVRKRVPSRATGARKVLKGTAHEATVP